ncbi:MAG: protoporphyrinogen oxidase [Acidobacteriota bacterium]|nr:protoporphyrinogen oxidase [Acidobacteriota bacterium]
MTAVINGKINKPGAARVVIVGGGISGLATAWFLQEQARHDHTPIDITLLEAGDRLGGILKSVHRDGCLLEAGPDSILLQKPAAMNLVRDLALKADVVYPSRSGSICILKDGRISPLPEGFRMVAPTRFWPTVRSPLFSLRGKARMAGDLFVGALPKGCDESLGSFVRRRLGDEVLERVVQPMLASIFLADADEMSLNHVMPRLAALENKFGSVIRGLRAQLKAIPGGKQSEMSFFSLRGGVGQLVDRLATRLSDVTLRTQAPVEKLTRRRGTWNLQLNNGETLNAEAVVLACPFYRGAEMLALSDPQLARVLLSTEYASCATVTLSYDADKVDHHFQGNGFFVPRCENLSFIACNFVHSKFPDRVPKGRVVLRVFVGGAMDNRLFDLSDDNLTERIHRELAPMFRISALPRDVFVHRYHRAMPQFEVGYGDKLARLRNLLEKRPGLQLAGGGTGVVGIPDCIQSGQNAAEAAYAQLFQLEAPLAAAGG